MISSFTNSTDWHTSPAPSISRRISLKTFMRIAPCVFVFERQIVIRFERQQVIVEKMLFFSMQVETNKERRALENMGSGETNQFRHNSGLNAAAGKGNSHGSRPISSFPLPIFPTPHINSHLFAFPFRSGMVYRCKYYFNQLLTVAVFLFTCVVTVISYR
jgi:hypothetical protein